MRRTQVALLTLSLTIILCSCASISASSGPNFFDPVGAYEETQRSEDAHSHNSSEQALVSPISTPEGLTESDAGFSFANCIDIYEFTSIESNKVFGEIADILWLNGKLYVADVGTMPGKIHILDKDLTIVDTITQVPGSSSFSPRALAADSDGKLYVLTNGTRSRDIVTFFIILLDANHSFEKEVSFTIPSKAEYLKPQSLVVAPDGNYYVSFYANESEADGKIYSIDANGNVTGSFGNKSFGYLLFHMNSLYFVNSGFPTVYDRGSGGYTSQRGLTALYRLNDGDMAAFVTFAPTAYSPFRDEEIDKWRQAYAELNGEPPTQAVESDILDLGFIITMQNGSRGLFSLGDEIAVINDYTSIMHVFDESLNYLYSQRLGTYNCYSEIYREFQTKSNKLPVGIAACADEEGNIYIARLLVDRDGSTEYEILKGTLKQQTG